MNIEMWPVERLKPHPRNPRGAVDPASVRELAESIAEVGLLQPLVVTPAGLIVAGHRRFAAAVSLGMAEVPVTVQDLAPTEQLVVLVVENLQRADLSPLAENRAFCALIEDGLTIADIVRRTGVSRERVSDRLALTYLDPATAALFDRGALPSGAVHVLASVDNLEVRHDLAGRVANHELTLKELRLAAGLERGQVARAERAASGNGVGRPPLEDVRMYGRCLVCQETRERLLAAMSALARAERVIRDNVSDIAVPARPSILKEVTHAR